MKQRPSLFVAFRQDDGRMDPPSRQIFRRYFVHQAEEMLPFLLLSKTCFFLYMCCCSLTKRTTFCRGDTLIQLTISPCRRLFICYILCCPSQVNQKTPSSNRQFFDIFIIFVNLETNRIMFVVPFLPVPVSYKYWDTCTVCTSCQILIEARVVLILKKLRQNF